MNYEDAINILTQIKKAYDSFCLFPNEDDRRDWDKYSERVVAIETALELLVNCSELPNN